MFLFESESLIGPMAHDNASVISRFEEEKRKPGKRS